MSAGRSQLRSAREPAHAKINVFLRVLGRGEDGYHSLETLFVRLALADDVEVTAGDGNRTLDCTSDDGIDVAALGPLERNLAWRAASLYADHCGWPRGFHVRFHKRIPLGGGLGGGSADAAAVLRALDSINPNPVGAGVLLQLAVELGADVPFLVSGEPAALAWGRGERMLALPGLPDCRVELLLPPFGVSTPAAFGWLAAERAGRRPGAAPGLLDLSALRDWASLRPLAKNDLEAPVLQRHPALHEGLDLLRKQGAVIAAMSGSGSTLFGIYEPGGAVGEWALPVGWRRITTRPG